MVYLKLVSIDLQKRKKNTLNLKCNLSLYTIRASQSPLLKKNYIKDQGPMFSQYGPEQAKLGYLIIRQCFTSPIVRKYNIGPAIIG